MNSKKKNYLLVGVIIILVGILFLIYFFGKEKRDTITVGMILTGSIDESGWNRNHYIGLKEASDELDVNIIIKQNVVEYTGECLKALDELLSDGAKAIILGSFNYYDEAKEIVEKHPEVSFYGIFSGAEESRVSTFSVRAYQARYLAGIVAGKQTKNNRIGYVAAMPNSEVYRGINAFALGTLSVNPEAEIYVTWTNSWDDEEAERQATRKLAQDLDIDLVTYHQNQSFVIDEAEKCGIYSIGYHEYPDGYSDKCLTAVVESWKNVYSEILKEYMQGNARESHMIWLGLEKDAVGLAPYSGLVSDETKKLVTDAAAKMKNGWEVFSDYIETNDGQVKCQNGEVISENIIFEKMDWFVKGVSLYEE